ncbi:MAG: hypothetical protein WC107_01665 [Patescibacteria group bacterium]
MTQITELEIEELAKEYKKKGKKWHFHILTPDCRLNQSNDFVMMLENTTDDESFVLYSTKPLTELGKNLLKLLYEEDMIRDSSVAQNENNEYTELAPEVQAMIDRAKELNKQGKFWHHHMFFPECMFNQDKGKWTIIFEDTEKGEIMRSVSLEEPRSELKHIEALFYNQKR